MADVSFEQKFGQLADAQISEKLPSLVEHRVGFQVIDKTDDDTKAVGIAAFIVNNLWLYIPIFFMKGDLNGLDLIYIKQQDIFVPAIDNWISSIKEHGTKALGNARDGEIEDRSEERATPENTQILDSYTEMGKAASFDSNSIINYDVWNRMCRHLTLGDTSSYKPVDLSKDLVKLGKTASHAFLETFLSNSDFSNSLFSFYTPSQVEMMAKESALLAATPIKPRDNSVKIFSDITSKEAQDLSDREKELLVKNGIYVKDTRTNLSKVFQEEVDSSILQNPAIPGIYDVLLSDGSFKSYIVLLPKNISEPSITSRRFSSNTDRPVCLIDIDDPSNYVGKRNTEVFCKPAIAVKDSQVAGVQGGKKATRQLLSSLDRDTGVLFVQNPGNSIETRILNRQSNPDGSFNITICNCSGHNDEAFSSSWGLDKNISRVEFVGPEASLRVETGCLFVPEGTRMFTRRGSYDKDSPKYPKQHTPKDISLGNSSTVLHAIMHKQANLRHLHIYSSGNNAQVIFDEKSTGLVPKEAALKNLIWRHGIDGGQALQMIKQAGSSKGNRKGFLLKHAAPYDVSAYGYAEPPWMGGPATSQEDGVTEQVEVSTGKSSTAPMSSDNSPILPDKVIEQAMQAAEQGIKEVFDVRVLQGLVDKADVSELRKDYISDMIVGMDKVGRMLFLFYWHNEDFEDRYGKEDLTKLEDTLLQVFRTTGDLVLFLREKMSYSPMYSEDLFGTLSEDVAV